MKSDKPLISILLPVYRSEKYLEDCLTSILSQSYKNIEVIAVVDYLKDDSLKILKKIRKKDKRLRIYKNVQTYGLAVTLNRAVRRSRGEFIAFMDSHGKSSLHRIARELHFLLENPKIGAVGTQSVVYDQRGRIVEKTKYALSHNEIVKGLPSAASMKFETVMVNRKALPSDILKFSKNKYPYIYSEVFLKIATYTSLANLNFYLTSTRITVKDQARIRLDRKISVLKLLLKSASLYDYKFSFKIFFHLIKPKY